MASLKEQRDKLLKDTQEIMSKAGTNPLSDEDAATANSNMDKIEELNEKIKAATEGSDRFAKLSSLGTKTDEDATPGVGRVQVKERALSLGDHFVKSVGDHLGQLREKGNQTVSAPEFTKAATDPQSNPSGLGVYVTQFDRTVVQAYRRPLVVADLLGSGTLTSANAVSYLVESATFEGGFTTVAEAGAKPQFHIGDPTIATDALKKIAGFIQFTDEMLDDFGFLASEINERGLYNLGLVEESQILGGNGTGSNVLGVRSRSGIQTETSAAAADNADAIFRAITKVQTATGFAADGIVINPVDYQNLRLKKDGNQQYYGGGFFSGEYGNGEVVMDPPLWGRRTVVTAAMPAGKVGVAAWKQLGTVYRKGGVRVESTNSHASTFTSNIITTRIEERIALAVRYPATYVEVTLSAV